jgi:hypothetical protein
MPRFTESVFTVSIYSKGGAWIFTLTHAFKTPLRSSSCSLSLCLRFIACELCVFLRFRVAMARVKSIAAPCDRAEVEEVGGHENLGSVPNGEGHVDSVSVNNGFGSGHEGEAGSQSAGDVNAASDESSRNYCFGSSIITVSRIQEMMMLNYFTEGDAHAPEEETVPEPEDDKTVIFEEFFFLQGLGCLRIPLSQRFC